MHVNLVIGICKLKLNSLQFIICNLDDSFKNKNYSYTKIIILRVLKNN